MKYKVLMGAPCYGMVQALTAQSLWDMAADGPVRLDDGTEFEFEFHPFAMGPYVHLNLTALLSAFRSSDADLFLRFDSDMVWTSEWVEHFFVRTNELFIAAPSLTGRCPMIHGGVYPRRQRTQNYTPIVQWLPGEVPATDAAWVEKSRRHYVDGTTHEAARVGGGWCLYNRAAAELPDESWEVKNGLGEDYGGCDAVSLAGGRVFATWPKANEAELGHAIMGLDYATIGDYLLRWNELWNELVGVNS